MVSSNYWGPFTWKTLHCLTYNCPNNLNNDNRKDYFYFFNYIVPVILPCPKCQKHFLKHLRDKPISKYLKCKDNLCQWLIDIHNSINNSNKKKILNKVEVDKIYSHNFYLSDIQQLIFFLKKRVQYGSLSPIWYNKVIYYLNKLLLFKVPTNNSGGNFNYC